MNDTEIIIETLREAASNEWCNGGDTHLGDVLHAIADSIEAKIKARDEEDQALLDSCRDAFE